MEASLDLDSLVGIADALAAVAEGDELILYTSDWNGSDWNGIDELILYTCVAQHLPVSMSIWITLRDATRGASNLLQTLPATMDDEPASRTMAQAHANRERTRSSRHRCGRRAGR